jgi:dTDP-4-amino-4,6-dideoxygalactose transaminase
MEIQTGDEVLAPAYYCGSEIDPLIKAGARVTLYRVDRSCRIDIADIRKRICKKTRVIYLTYFYGFPQDIHALKELCDQYGLYLLEDCALSLFSLTESRNLGATGDLSVFNLTKVLPVPDGGILIVNNKMLNRAPLEFAAPDKLIILRRLLPFLKSNILRYMSRKKPLQPSYRILYWLLNGKRIREIEKEIQKAGQSKIRSDMYYDARKMHARTMSSWTKRMLGAYQPDKIRKARRENYTLLACLLRGLRSVTILFPDLEEGVCPLNLPILVENRDRLHIELYKRGIDAGAYWKGYHSAFPLHEYPEAQYLKNHVLALPIHQELDERHVRYIADTLIDVLKGN